MSLPVLCDGLRLKVEALVPDEARGTVVLLHGIPSVAPPDPDDEGYPGLARVAADRGWVAVWAAFRGARDSPGYFSIEGWVRDARAIIDAARTVGGESGGRLAVVGSSAGGAVAVEAVCRGAPVDAIVLWAAPARWVTFAGDAAAGVRHISEQAGMPLAPDVLEDPTAWAAEFERVVPEKSVAGVGVPVLVIHGTDDDVVPVDHARRLAVRSSRAEMRLIEGAPHQLRRHPETVAVTFDWLERVVG